MLHVQLLGPLEVREDDDPIRLGGTKQRILLATLVLAEGQSVTAAALQEAMWSETEPDRDRRHALQAHVSRLRALLPLGIELGPGGYRVDPGSFTVDAVRFSDLLARGRDALQHSEASTALRLLEEALALWRGPSLADLAETVSLQPHVVRLEELRRRAQTDRVDALLALGRASDAIPDLHATLEHSPLQEHTWHQLISALHRADRLSEALDSFQQARSVFLDQLGTEPGPRLHDLHQRLLQQPGPSAAAGSTPDLLAPEIGRRLTTPLAGRQRELSVLRRLGNADESGLRLVTITGEPGIGKTRLAAEFAAERSRAGSPVLFGRCDEFMAVPYQPFIEIIRADVGNLSGDQLARRLGPYPAELTRLVPDLAERLPPGVTTPLRSDPHTELYRTFDAVAGWLAAASRAAPLTLVLDDLQWADRPTILLVRHLARTPRPVRALVLTTLRDRESSHSPEAGDLLTDLVRQSETVTNLPLVGLHGDEVAALLDTELVGSPATASTAAMAAWVSTASGGNPLFVVELARSLADSGTVATEPGSESLPLGLRELIRRRLDRLAPDVTTLLETASAMGPDFDVPVLAGATGTEASELDHALAAADFARLIKPVDGPGLRYTFSHDVVRSALYDAIPPVRRSATHHLIAETMERHHGPRAPGHATELAHHFTMALGSVSSDTDRAVHYLRLAGDDAIARSAPSVAVDQYQQAIDLLPPSSAIEERCDLMTDLGTALFRSGDAAFREVLLEVGRLARHAGDGPRLAAAAIANSRGWWSSTAEIDHERIAVIEAALEGCQPDETVVRCQLLAAWALENVRDPDQREAAIRRSTEALALAEQSDDEELLAVTLSHHYAVTYATFSDPQGCIDLNERIFALARKRADPGLRLNATIGLAQSAATLGEFTVSDGALAQALELSEMLHEPSRLWMTRTWQAMRAATRGDVAHAEILATSAYELGVETGQPDAFTWFAGQLFTFRMLTGRLHELSTEIEEHALSAASGIPSWQAAYAVSLSTVDRKEEAAKILDEFVSRDFAQLPVDMLWLHGMCYLCMVCDEVGDPDAARAVYATLAPHSGLVANNGTIDAGPVDLHLGIMARTLGDHHLAAEHLAAAEETCLRIDAPLWLERVRRAAA